METGQDPPDQPRGPQSPAPGADPPGGQPPAPGQPLPPQPAAPVQPAPGAQPPPPSAAPGVQPPAPLPPGYAPRGQPPPGAPPPPGYAPVRPPKQLPPAVAGRELASWGSRVGALVLEGLIEIGVWLVPGIVLGVPAIILLSNDSTAIGVVLLVILGLISLAMILVFQPYFMNRDGEHNGQTLGKQVLGITVVRDAGERMEFGSAFVRQVLVIQGIPWVMNSFAAVVIIPFGSIALLIDYLWPLWDDQDNRCLHDMICKTHVVRT